MVRQDGISPMGAAAEKVRPLPVYSGRREGA